MSVVPHQLFEASTFKAPDSLRLYSLLFCMLLPLIVGEPVAFTDIAVLQNAIVLSVTVAFPISSPVSEFVIRLLLIVAELALLRLMPPHLLFEMTTSTEPSPSWMKPLIVFPVISAEVVLYWFKIMLPLMLLSVNVAEQSITTVL